MKGLEPSTFCMASRAGTRNARQRTTTNACNHARFSGLAAVESLWLRGVFRGRLGHEWGALVGRLSDDEVPCVWRWLSRGIRITMAEGFVHTVRREEGWANTIEGEDQPLPGTFETKQAAVIAGRDEAMRRKTEHVIHDQDGTIGERNSYGSDPSDRPG